MFQNPPTWRQTIDAQQSTPPLSHSLRKGNQRGAGARHRKGIKRDIYTECSEMSESKAPSSDDSSEEYSIWVLTSHSIKKNRMTQKRHKQ
eukprot:9438102-Karenia_brevis.AAC.1